MLDINLWTASYFEENAEQCLNLLNDQHNVEQVPLLNNITDYAMYNNKLVRFRGMIQDILNPVYYMEKFKVRDMNTDVVSYRSGKYCDSIDIKENEEIINDFSGNMYSEKHTMHCVLVPSLNTWVSQFRFVDDQYNVAKRERKRKLLQSNTEIDVEEKSFNQLSECNKRLSSEGKLNRENECSGDAVLPENNASNSMKAINESLGVSGILLNIYDCKNMNVMVNDVLEVVGFLSVRSNDQHIIDENNYYDSLARVHVVSSLPMASIFDNMLKFHKDYIFENALSLRDDLWIMFTDLLLGDTLAADYLICHLISSVYLRRDSLALGKFSLNISNVPENFQNFDYVSSLYKFLAHLLEKSLYLSVTIPYLNNTTMIPKQNHNENRLVTGLLQVPLKTHVVINETKLEPGQLFDRGVRNVQALSDVITMQRLEYDFEFYKLPFNTDIPVLTLSRGKSLFPNDAHLVLDPDESCIQHMDDAFTRVWDKMTDPLLSKLRVYLNYISSENYSVSPALQQVVENDFVQMRQDTRNYTTVDDLHRLMVLSRLMALSKGLDTLEKDVWEYTCRMESQRKARL